MDYKKEIEHIVESLAKIYKKTNKGFTTYYTGTLNQLVLMLIFQRYSNKLPKLYVLDYDFMKLDTQIENFHNLFRIDANHSSNKGYKTHGAFHFANEQDMLLISTDDDLILKTNTVEYPCHVKVFRGYSYNDIKEMCLILNNKIFNDVKFECDFELNEENIDIINNYNTMEINDPNIIKLITEQKNKNRIYNIYSLKELELLNKPGEKS